MSHETTRGHARTGEESIADQSNRESTPSERSETTGFGRLIPDGGQFLCHRCETLHDSMRATVECCSEAFNDEDEDGAAPPVTLPDGGRLGNPTFLCDQIGVERDGEQLTVWNSLIVKQHHNVGVNSVETHHTVLAGDGSTGEEPEYITPAMAEQLRALEVYRNAEVVDPASEEVTVL